MKKISDLIRPVHSIFSILPLSLSLSFFFVFLDIINVYVCNGMRDVDDSLDKSFDRNSKNPFSIDVVLISRTSAFIPTIQLHVFIIGFETSHSRANHNTFYVTTPTIKKNNIDFYTFTFNIVEYLISVFLVCLFVHSDRVCALCMVG